MPTGMRAAVYAAFFFSGFTGLVFEILWSRQFVTVFGNSSYAITTVLCAFMAGLGIGGILGGRLADRCSERLLAYAAMQAGVATWALLVPYLLSGLRAALPTMAGLAGGSPTSILALRFLFSFAVLFVPCVLMGMTLPVLCRHCAERRAVVGSRVGALYGLNTLGAAAGCFAAGYLLLDRLGVSATNGIAVGLDYLLALLILLVRVRRPRQARPAAPGADAPADSDTAVQPAVQRLLLAFAFFAGFASLSCQVLWTRLLAFFSTSTAYTFTTILGLFLVGLGLGSLVYRALLAKSAQPIRLLATVAGLLGVALPIGFAVAAIIPPPLSGERQMLAVLTVAAIVSLLPAVLMGIVFPLVCAAVSPTVAAVGRNVGRVAALNTAGAIVGAAAPVFILIPRLGVQHGLLAIAGLYLLAGAALVVAEPGPRRKRRGVAAAAAAVTALVALAVLIPADLGQRAFLNAGRPLGNQNEIVFWREGRTAAAVVVRDRVSSLDSLYINRTEEVPTTPGSVYCFKLLAALGPLLHPDPRDVLMICFGGGIAAGATAQFPDVTSLEIVDIEGAVLAAAPLFAEENNRVLDNPKVKVVVEDGRNYLQASARKWSVIVSDSTHPKAPDSWVLYSREFYALVRDRLADRGVFVQWIPIHDLSVPEYKIILRTFQSVFPHASAWLTYSRDPQGEEIYTVLAATPGPLVIDYQGLDAKLGAPAVAADLRPYALHRPEGILETFVCGEATVRAWVGEGPINTDNMPWTYYRTRYSGAAITLPVFSALMESAGPYLANAGDEEALARVRRDLERRVQASKLLFAGRHEDAWRRLPGDGRLGRVREAIVHGPEYARAAARANWDRPVVLRNLAETMVNWPGGGPVAESLLRRVIELEPTSVGALGNLGLALAYQGRADEAIALIERALRIDPRDASALNNMGVVLFMQGKMDHARQHFQRCLDADPEFAQAHYHVGLVLAAQGKPAESVVHFRRALLGMPGGVDIHYNLARVLIAEGMTEEAIEHCRMAVRIDPGFVDARYALGAHALQLGRADEAVEHFSIALEFRPDHPEARQGLERATALRGVAP